MGSKKIFKENKTKIDWKKILQRKPGRDRIKKRFSKENQTKIGLEEILQTIVTHDSQKAFSSPMWIFPSGSDQKILPPSYKGSLGFRISARKVSKGDGAKRRPDLRVFQA